MKRTRNQHNAVIKSEGGGGGVGDAESPSWRVSSTLANCLTFGAHGRSGLKGKGRKPRVQAIGALLAFDHQQGDGFSRCAERTGARLASAMISTPGSPGSQKAPTRSPPGPGADPLDPPIEEVRFVLVSPPEGDDLNPQKNL